MLKKILILVCLTLFVCFGKSFASNNLSEKFKNNFNPQKYPTSASFYDAQKNTVLLSKYAGKVIVLNFWKATCRTCLVELPSLNRLADKYPDIVVLAISEGDEDALIIDRILHKERRLNRISVNLDENQKLLKILGGGNVPQTHLIDKDGFVRGTINGGANFDSPLIHQQIEELM